MNRIINFVRMDFYSIRQYRRTIIVVLAILLINGFIISPPLMVVLLMILMAMYSTYPFMATANNQLSTLYATLPLTSRDVVRGRYAFALAMLALGSIIFLTHGLIFNLIFSTPISPGSMCLTVLLAASIFLLLVSLYYPLYFRLHAGTAQIYASAAILLIFPLLAAVRYFAESHGYEFSIFAMIYLLEEIPPALGLLTLAIGMLSLGASYLVSCRYYQRFDQGVRR